MNTEKLCSFNFSYNKVKNKIDANEKELKEIVIKLKDLAVQKNIKYFDIDRNKRRQELKATNYPEALSLLEKFNKLNDNLKRLNGLLDKVSEKQRGNIIDRKISSQKYEYQTNVNGKAYLIGIQLPSSNPEYIFSLTDYYKPVFSKTYEIKGTIFESFIVNSEEDRIKILLRKDIEEVLFLGDKAFIKRIDNIYLVKNEMTEIYEWTDNEFSINSANSSDLSEEFELEKSNCIYRVVPFIKSEWLGKEIRESKDLNDRTPWEDFYNTVNTSGYIRII